MGRYVVILGCLALLTGAALVVAQPALAVNYTATGMSTPSRYLQCVPYARQTSGIQIFGDAHTWWQQAEGRYPRGGRPVVGAVMALKPHGRMQLGHVATISRLVDTRTVLLRHANWSPISGRRGQIENDVPALDVSPNNDWSAVRVWFNPIRGLGSTRWPVQGFIYNARPGWIGRDDTQLASRAPFTVQRPPQASPAPAKSAAPVKPAVPAVSAGSWRIQLGAFGVAANAEALWNRVKTRPELAGHERLTVPAGKVSRLQAGGFASREAAQATCNRLGAAGFSCIVA